jgi:hypothetical protein
MSDGPPWVRDVRRDNVPGGFINPPGGLGFHVTLDENRRWTITAQIIRAADNHNEISVMFVKPTFMGGGDVFLQMNDAYPGLPLTQTNYKFDNEDIYVFAQWKPTYNPSEAWGGCEPVSGIYSNSTVGPGGLCIIELKSPQPLGHQADIRVSILV